MNATRRVMPPAATLALLAAPLVALAGQDVRPPTDDRPNILFIFTDDHAIQAISAYGSVINETPNIDRIAAEGVRFDNCVCANSICAPSRATILTGKHSHMNGVLTNAEIFDGEQQTFPKLLHASGYETAMIGKWHLKSAPTGFDFYHVLIGQGPYYNPPFLTPEGRKTYEGYTTDIITDLALDWLDDGREGDRPFLLMCQHKAPHRNWMPGPDHMERYEGVDIPEPPTLHDDYANRASGAANTEMTIADHMSGMYDLKLDEQFDHYSFGWEADYLNGLTEEQRAAWEESYARKNAAWHEAVDGRDLTRRELTSLKYQRYIKDYLRSIASVDDNIGRILDYLDESGLAENTIVIYSSDQGFYLGEHGWYDKRWMYEESLHMPFIVRWPGRIEPGRSVEALAQNIDFGPTFLDIAGLTTPADMQGRSLVPLLEGDPPDDWRESIYYHYYESTDGPHHVPRHYGVRTDRFKLIHYYRLGEWELFDLERDPLELHSRHDDPAYADIVAELETELARLQVEYGQEDAVNGLEIGRQRSLMARAARAPLTLVQRNKTVRGDEAPIKMSAYALPLTVGSFCTPDADGQGVIAAGGGEQIGFTLYLDDGRPCFGVRNNGIYFEIKGSRRLVPGVRTHVAAILDDDARMHLYVDGREVAAADWNLIAWARQIDYAVGRDVGSNVGDYEGPHAFSGELHDVRLYTGQFDLLALERWARSGG